MKYKLGDLVNISHGYPFKSNTFSDTPTKFVILTPGNIKIGGGFQFGKGKYLRENTKFPEKYMLEPGTIFLNMTDLSKQGDTLGYPAIVPDSGYTFLHNQRLGVISIKDDKDSVIDLYYLFYALRIREYHHFILGSATGTTVRHTSPKKIMDYEISLPSINIQRKISYMLHKIEEKIHLNNQIISNLEELSSTLFKRWFVDFEFPDENGNPYKSSGGKMGDSEFGEIPEYFQVKKLSDIADVIGGGTPSKKVKEYFEDGNISWITPKDLSINKNIFIDRGKTSITRLGLDKSSAKLLPKNSILFSSRAPIGYTAISKNELATNQGFKSLIALDGIPYQFIFHLVKRAVLEQNGQLTIVEYGDESIRYPIIVDGQANMDVLELIKKDEHWLLTQIQEQGFQRLQEIYLGEYLSGQLSLSPYEEKTIS